ncbi:MAG: hypothetical protein ACRDLK_12855 [Gaiellaceae bacterium]
MPLAELRSVRHGRLAAGRLGGRATLLLDLRDGRVLSIASLHGIGSLHELDERLRAALAD